MAKNLKSIAPSHPKIAEKIDFYQDMLFKEGIEKIDESKLPPVINPRNKTHNLEELNVYEALCRNEYQNVSM